MVIFRTFIWVFFCSFVAAYGQGVQITAEIDNGMAYENMPATGTITITHSDKDKIDATSFQIAKKPLKVDLLKDVKISPGDPTTVSFYKFSIEGKPRGIQTLPEITVKIGNAYYKSYAATYEVKGAVPSAQAPISAPGGGSEAPFLKLEAFIKGASELYPGQRTTVGYRFSFNTSIDLEKEELPLLEAQGFRKIGDKNVRDLQQGAVSISEFSQIIEAIKPGDYAFGPSSIQGKAYQITAAGQKAYISGELRSEAEKVKMKVLGFPEKGKPPSFTGAIGPLSMNVALESPSRISLGDLIRLRIDLSGDVELENLTLPDLCCQPGFTGFFKASDIPPAGTIQGKTKTFLAELRPLVSEIKAIPPVAFSYFDPQKESYVTLESKEIPLEITAGPAPQAPEKPPEVKAQGVSLPSIQVTGNYPLSLADLFDTPFGSWNVFALLPLGIILLFLQMYAKGVIDAQRKIVVPMSSQELLNLALQKKQDSQEFFYYLNRSLMRFLVEKGAISNIEMNPEDLPEEGMAGKAKALLLDIENKRFTGDSKAALEDFASQIQAFMKENK